MRLRRAALSAGLVSLAACSSRVVIFEPFDAGRIDGGGGAPDARPGDAQREPDALTDADVTPGGSVVRTAAAFEHTCVAGDAGIACWGRNRDGELGKAWGEPSALTPKHLSDAADVTQLCAGERHTCALHADGGVSCFGDNDRGQLGVGDRNPRDEPTPVLGRQRFAQLACGGRLSCAIDDDQTLYCWGDNSEGAPGQDDTYGAPDLLAPTRVAVDRKFKMLGVGQGHVCAVDVDGTLFCWGRNTQGQLGLGQGSLQLRAPAQVASDERFKRVAAGQMHTCAITLDGRLFCWGTGLDGRLGLGVDHTGEVLPPSQVSSFSDFTEVQASWFHSCALRAAGELVCWGRNAEGQLGVGDFAPRYAPTEVALGTGVNAFAVGRFHSCGARDGRVYCWGKNDEGQLGVVEPPDRARPNLVRLADAL